MTSKIFIARNNLTIDANFSPNIIFVKSSVGNKYFLINTSITINIADSVSVDKIFIVKCFTDATIITPSWTTKLQNGSCIAFTRLNILSAQPIRAGESCAIISMLTQSMSVNASATIASIVDSASEIGMPNSSMVVQPFNCFVYYSTTGGLMFAQTFILRSLPGTGLNSAMELMSYPMLPGMDGNADEATLIPVLSQNSQTYVGVPFQCSASSEQYSWTAAYMGFNSAGSWFSATGTTGWLQIKLPFSVVVDKFEITTGLESPPWENFTRWEILGSNDGVTFKRLFYSDLQVPRPRTRFYFTDNIAPYMYYRFNGLEGTGNNCGISELQFYPKATPQLRFVETSSNMKNDNYNVNRNLVIDMPANIPVYFWFTPAAWPAATFSGYCVIRK